MARKNKQSRPRMKTADGFQNVVAKLGFGEGSGNVLSQGTYIPTLLTRNRILLEWMYRGSWIVGKVVDCYAEDMTREGIEITSGDTPENIEELQKYISNIGVWSALTDLCKWARLYGGAVAIIDIDGQDISTPLDVSTVSKGQFNGLVVYDRWQINPVMSDLVESGRDAGLPRFYQITTANDAVNGGGVATGGNVHHSRVIRMVGVKLPFFQAITEMMWGESVIERMQDRLISYDTATLGAANLVNRAHLRTVKVDGLRTILAAGGEAEENLVKMFRYIRELQTSEGLTLLDKDDEMSYSTYTFSGLSDVMLQFSQQLAGACDTAQTRLFGQSPAGMNATGESDMRMYYDGVKSQQESKLREGMSRILAVSYRSKFGKDIPADLDFNFVPLWQTSDTEKATIAKTKTEAIVSAYDDGLLDKPTAMRELAQISDTTGMYSNLTPKVIAEAESEPPLPQVEKADEEAANGV